MEQHKDLQIPLKEIASNTFHEANYLGGGGFGPVYKGELSRFKERGMVAFKKLDRMYGQGETEFFKEIEMLSQYKNENIITLLGYCMEGKEQILVYEYASHGSLDFCLDSPLLTWNLRLKICLQAAKGLRYLHDPNESHVRVIHRDIKSANILLDDKWNAKVSDFGLSKISPEKANNVTYATGTTGYLDPQYHKTYTLTEKSDVYSFGVTLFEVLCGRLCYDIIGNNELLVFVRKWMKSYEDNTLEEIVFKELDMKETDLISIELFSNIAYKCLNESRNKRPTMADVVKELEVALQQQESYEVFLKIPLAKEILQTVVSPIVYRSIDELKERLSEGVLVNGGKTWISLNEKGYHQVVISIEDCLMEDYHDDYVHYIEDIRVAAACFKTRHKEFKLNVRSPSVLSPNVTYSLSLVIHSRKPKLKKQQHVGVRYKIRGETKISVMQFVDKRKCMVAELYQFTNYKDSILDLEILFEDCGLSGYIYIEGIVFQPLEQVESPIVVANKEIVTPVVPPLFYNYSEELKVLLSQGILLNEGKMWISLNEKGAHHVVISIEEYLMGDYHDDYVYNIKHSRVAAACYKTSVMNVKLHVRTPLFLSPEVIYGLSLVFHQRVRTEMKQQHVGIRYKIHGETKISIVQFVDGKEGNWLVARLYQFTSHKDSILDLEISFEECGLSGDLYLEGIEFQPLKRVESSMVVANEKIARSVGPPLFYNYTEELKVLLSQGILLNQGKMWLSLNEKDEHIVVISIQVYMKGDHHDYYRFMASPRVAAAWYKTRLMKFKLHVTTPLFLSPDVRYGLQLVIYSSEIETIKELSIGIRYKIQGETKISILQFDGKTKRHGNSVVAEFYEFTNYKDSILDLEISFKNCGLTGDFYIEGIEFLPLEKAESAMVVANKEIARAVVPSMFYEFTKHPEQLLTQRVILNKGKKVVSMNDKGQNIEWIEIGACFDGSSQLQFDYSRWPFYEYKDEFKASVRAEYLSPHVSYTLYICFQFKSEEEAKEYSRMKYKLDGEETKVFIIYPTYKTEEGWFLAPLYQFTSQCSSFHLDIMFQQRVTELRVAAIQLTPSEEKVDLKLDEEYEDILKAASQPLVYRSLDDIIEIFLIGVFLNEHKTWFMLKKKGENYEMVSMKDCLIPNEDYSDRFKSHPSSRFPAGFFETNGEAFKTHVNTQFLSRRIKYTIYLVFKSSSVTKQAYVGLKYRLRGETTTSTVYLADPREEDDLHMAELFRFTSNGRTFDLEIDFDGHEDSIRIEGILFQPLEEVEDQPLEDSDSDNWEEKFPNDYEEILKLSKDRVRWTTKKELYSIFCRGLLLDKGQQWFTIDKNGKKCQMVCARASLVSDQMNSTWESLPQSRFGEMLVITADDKFKIWRRIASQDVSPETRYACHLVYKLPLDQSTFDAPLHVNINNGHAQDARFVYLSAPNSPVIGQILDENTCNPLNRYKGNGIPQQRSDGWMEVKVWEFQTQDTRKSTRINLKLTHLDKKDLSGLMVQGIELRPI